jgi:hypothetical protein
MSTKPYQPTERRNSSHLAPFDQELTVLVTWFDPLKIRSFYTVSVSFGSSIRVLWF